MLCTGNIIFVLPLSYCFFFSDVSIPILCSLIKAMKWDEDKFGLECDLDMYNIVATDDFNMGAMFEIIVCISCNSLILIENISIYVAVLGF